MLLGCASSSSEPPPVAQPAAAEVTPGQPFELPIGATATVADTGLQVAFRAVTEDSRCPRRVNCIWAGRATVDLEVSAPNVAAETVLLSTCCAPNDQRQYVYAGQTIALVDLAPVRDRPED